MISTIPAYNIKVVLKETGLAADTLRAWERRYGLPFPKRSTGGHRIYSQFDIEAIKWLMARQAEGLSISRAVDSWNEKIASGADPLAGFAPSTFSSAQATPAIYIAPGTNLDSLRAQWIAACMKFSESSSEQVLNQAFSMFPVESVCMEILQKGMAEIGNLWYENKSSVQQEHFASGLAMRRLDSLISASPVPSRNQTVIVGCAPNEWHTFTALLLSLLLRRRGLNVIYLGANVPTDYFEETVSTIKGNLVVLIAQTLTSAAALQLTAFIFAKERLPVCFGGRIFNTRPDLVDTIPGHFLGSSVDSSLEEIEKLLKGKVKAYNLKTASQEYRAAHQAFISNRTHIESTITELAQLFSINPEGLNTGIQFLGDNISAALQLGDMDHVNDEMEWIKTLMHSHQQPPEELAYFMEIYSKAVDKHINNQGEPIRTWLKKQAQLAS